MYRDTRIPDPPNTRATTPLTLIVLCRARPPLPIAHRHRPSALRPSTLAQAATSLMTQLGFVVPIAPSVHAEFCGCAMWLRPEWCLVSALLLWSVRFSHLSSSLTPKFPQHNQGLHRMRLHSMPSLPGESALSHDERGCFDEDHLELITCIITSAWRAMQALAGLQWREGHRRLNLRC